MASPQMEKFLSLIAKGPAIGDLSVEQMRSMLDKTGGQFPAGVHGTPVEAGGVRAEWVDPEGGADDRAVLYLHGGGYVAGSIDSHRNLIGHLASATGGRVLALDYRLAPEHPATAPVEDSVAAYRWLLDQGFPPAKLAIAGDSAGGGLVMATLLALKEQGVDQPSSAVGISAWVDMELGGESMATRADVDPLINPAGIQKMAETFLGGADPRHPLVSPLLGELSGLPPLLLQVGDHETLLDDSTRFAAKAEAAGVDTTLEVWPEMVHVWHGSAGFVPEADQAIARIAEFLAGHVTS